MQNPTATNRKVVQLQSRSQLSSLSPNDGDELCQVLRKSLSTNRDEQKLAENTLNTIEKRNGYLSLLLVCFFIFRECCLYKQ